MNNFEFLLNELGNELKVIDSKLETLRDHYQGDQYYDTDQISINVYKTEYYKDESLWQQGENGEPSFAEVYQDNIEAVLEPYINSDVVMTQEYIEDYFNGMVKEDYLRNHFCVYDGEGVKIQLRTQNEIDTFINSIERIRDDYYNLRDNKGYLVGIYKGCERRYC